MFRSPLCERLNTPSVRVRSRPKPNFDVDYGKENAPSLVKEDDIIQLGTKGIHIEWMETDVEEDVVFFGEVTEKEIQLHGVLDKQFRVSAAKKVQKLWRWYMGRMKWRKNVASIRTLQCHFKFRRVLKMAFRIQLCWKRYKRRKLVSLCTAIQRRWSSIFATRNMSAIVIQSLYRRRLAQKRFTALHNRWKRQNELAARMNSGTLQSIEVLKRRLIAATSGKSEDTGGRTGHVSLANVQSKFESRMRERKNTLSRRNRSALEKKKEMLSRIQAERNILVAKLSHVQSNQPEFVESRVGKMHCSPSPASVHELKQEDVVEEIKECEEKLEDICVNDIENCCTPKSVYWNDEKLVVFSPEVKYSPKNLSWLSGFKTPTIMKTRKRVDQILTPGLTRSFTGSISGQQPLDVDLTTIANTVINRRILFNEGKGEVVFGEPDEAHKNLLKQVEIRQKSRAYRLPRQKKQHSLSRNAPKKEQ